MRLLRSHLTVAILIIGMSALPAFGSPAPASKKKAKSTTSSKGTQTSSRTKSKKPQKEQPKQARNSRQTPGLKTPTTSKSVEAEPQSPTQTVLANSSRKGKKGFSSGSQVNYEAATRTTPQTSLQKTAAVATPTPLSISKTSAGSTAFPTQAPKPETNSGSQPVAQGGNVNDDAQPSVPLPAAPASNQPDKIDVIEYRDAQRNASGPRSTSSPSPPGRIFGISNRRIDVDIDTPRIIQIQKALKDKGFYSLEPTGIYDEDTINAMKAFQQSEHIDVTGYPTAHALKRLGL